MTKPKSDHSPITGDESRQCSRAESRARRLAEPAAAAASGESGTEGREDRGDGRDARGRMVDPAKAGDGLETRWAKGNTDSLVDGGRAVVIFERPDVMQIVKEKAARVMADCGGDDAAVTLEDTARQYARTEFLLDDVFERVVERGVFTATGRTRKVFDAFLALLDRHVRLATVIGLRRKAKPALTLEQYVRAKYGSASKDSEDAHDDK
jgi:hypothetical protein